MSVTFHTDPAGLAATIAAEDAAEDAGTLDPDDRRTCHTHQRWAGTCPPSDLHIMGGNATYPKGK